MRDLIKFNIWKHHLNKIKDVKRSHEYDLSNPEKIREFLEILKSIGTNSIDLYTGEASIDELFDYFENVFKKSGVYESLLAYSTWIGKKNYKKINFSDGSEWIFRLGNEKDRFIHIHPGRNCLHVIRLNANWWKTAILIFYIEPVFIEGKALTLYSINNIRKKYLGLSPIKSLKPGNDLEKGRQLLLYSAIT